MSLQLMYITNNLEVALIAEKYGVNRVWVDLETIGKEERQIGRDSVKSHHTINDIRVIKPHLTTSEMLVRVNHWHEGSLTEIEQVIAAGADMVMLPYWKTIGEVQAFLEAVNGRCKTTLLLETKEAVECIDEVLNLGGFDEIHIGLNDLHLSYGLDFMFEPLANGTVEMLCRKFKAAGISYGFGGIAKIGDGAIPAEKLILEHYRLGSTRAILSRTFCDNAKVDSIEEIDRVFAENMKSLRQYEEFAATVSEEYLRKNCEDVRTSINKVAELMKQIKPFYLLESDNFRQNYEDLAAAFRKYYPKFNIAYSYKTNYTPKLARIVDSLGGYAEVVSDMELEIALRSGITPAKIIWNGPIKNPHKVRELLFTGGTVNLDSIHELENLRALAVLATE